MQYCFATCIPLSSIGRCQVATRNWYCNPFNPKVIEFTCVSVPPDITDEETSSDITVQEGENATMVCRATGHPVPRILWRREDGESLVLRKGLRDVTKGKALQLTKCETQRSSLYTRGSESIRTVFLFKFCCAVCTAYCMWNYKLGYSASLWSSLYLERSVVSLQRYQHGRSPFRMHQGVTAC